MVHYLVGDLVEMLVLMKVGGRVFHSVDWMVETMVDWMVETTAAK